ncbi:MAG: hypothetical protein EXX96DRAFT_541659 [Benjaminiella poitrasii]|nr:MAG: hypothetical protein EXX96DRAFT_541659 [Benjaminiella poitrasii]
MQIVNNDNEQLQHPLAISKKLSSEEDEKIIRKSPQSRRRRRGSRRHSSSNATEGSISENHNSDINITADGGNGSKLTTVQHHPNHHRRRSSSNIHYHNKLKDNEQDSSPAFHSLVDMINEMKRLPSLPENDASQHPKEWKRVRRHSEPFQQRLGEIKLGIGSHLQPIYEQSFPDNETTPHQPVFSGPTFLPLQHNENDMEDTLVSPLSTEKQPSKRSRSQSVPNTSKPYKHITTTRKSLYPAYLTVSDASAAIRSHKLYAGILKINAQDSSNANVECEALDAPIYIFGSRNRNRALNGDEVAVELVNVDDMLNEKRVKRQVRLTRRLSALSLHTNSLSSIPEDHFLEESMADLEHRPKYCGRVVCVLERPRDMLFSGTLSLNRPAPKTPDAVIRDKKESHHPKIIWFTPADKRLPLVAVPIKFAPSNFVKYHEEYKNRIFIGNIQRWPATSLHPFGTIKKEIGWMGELRVHSGALMADNHIKDIDFPEAVVKAAQFAPKFIRNEDRKGRLDLTKDKSLNIFTISHKEQSIDHAFSFRMAEKGVYEVGIHVTDMTKYIRENTPLDHEARERSCVVKLVDKTIPILPLDFTEPHYSLGVDKERLTFSVICRFTETGQRLHVWIGKTVIKVKERIDPLNGDITQNASQFLELCRKLQQKRLKQEGGLVVNQQKPTISFQLAESGYPENVELVNQLEETEDLIQELLILANIEVGQKISSRFPDQALLYRQDAPKMSKLTMVRDYFHDEEGSKDTVQDLFRLIKDKEPLTEKQQTLNYIVKQSIPPPKYFSAGSLDISKYRNYGFGASICTLFTEPIHNYASIHAQRQLNAVLRGEAQREEGDSVDFDTIDKVARHCNASYLSKLAAERESMTLYTAAHIHRQCLSVEVDEKMKGRMIVASYVIGLDTDLVQLYVPDYDMEIPVTLNDQSLTGAANHHYDSTLNEMKIAWKQSDNNSSNEEEDTIQKLKFLSCIDISIHVDMKAVRPLFDIELIRP